MSYEYDLANKLKKINKKPPYEAAWYKAVCTSISPLTFSIVDGNLIYNADNGLTLTATLKNSQWRTGDTAAAILSGEGLLLIDRL